MDLLLDENLRVGTSTPLADPCGDYSWQLFDNIEQVYPTQGLRLKQQALQLVGGSQTSVPIPQGEIASAYLLGKGYADLFIGYAHYQNQLAQNPDLLSIEIDPAFNPKAIYVAGLLNETPTNQQLFDFLSSTKGQKIIQQNGFGMV